MRNLLQQLTGLLFVAHCSFAQNIGLGTNTPQARLHIKGTGGGTQIILEENAGTVLRISNEANAAGPYIGTSSNHGFSIVSNNAVRLVVASNGNVGIGTNNPQSLLELNVGSGRSMRFKNDLVPAFEIASSNTNDGLAGILRFRNALEIMPSSDGTRAGKLDVRNAAGDATIILNGSSGILQANTIQASSVNATSLIASGGIVGQSIYAPNMPGYFCKPCSTRVNLKRNATPPLDVILCDVVVEIPAAGVLVLEGWTDAWLADEGALFPGETAGFLEYKLDEYTTGNSYISTLQKNEIWHPTAQPYVRVHLNVNTAGMKRYKMVLYKKDVAPGATIITEHYIRGWYYPAWMNAQ